MNIAVLGSGSWATAIVKILIESHEKVFWWVREEEIKQGVMQYGYNPLFLSYCELDKNRLEISTDIRTIMNKADMLFFVIPAAFLEYSLEGLNEKDFENKNIVSAIKGIVPSRCDIVSRFFEEKYNISKDRLAIISGPSHAEEVAQEKLTFLTCASENKELAEFVSEIIKCRFISTVISDDIEGIEYCTVMKNIYAVATGIAKGMGYGDNFVAAMISVASIEMERFIKQVDNRPRDIKRLAYLGDLLVTCYSQHSRNRTFGQMIGSGYRVQSAQLEMNMVAEGYYSAANIHKINEKYKVDLPIAESVYKILYENASKKAEFKTLMEIFQ